MQPIEKVYAPAPDLTLGTKLNERLDPADQKRQRLEVEEILHRLRKQPGVILADEVGMGKTFVALGIAYSVAVQSPRGPVIVMVPANLVEKWEQDLKSFCELYLEDRRPLKRIDSELSDFLAPRTLRYGVARHSIQLLKLLDDPPRERCHFIFLAQGAMGRSQTDKWTRLALIAEALRQYGRGGATRLTKVRRHIHKYVAELIWAIGEQRSHEDEDELWRSLLSTHPSAWKNTFNNGIRDENRRLDDDPVPKSIVRAVNKIDLRALADALKQMPVRASTSDKRLSERLNAARYALREVEEDLWKEILALAPWRSPLLVMDEAHHLKNPGTLLARQLQSPDMENDLRTGDGAMARVFDRMLFLTATPFQLGHRELVHVLRRFGDIKWNAEELGEREEFERSLDELGRCLDESQRAAIALRRSWSRLLPEDCETDVREWWERLRRGPRDTLTNRQRAVFDAFDAAKQNRDLAQSALRPWLVRHNKGSYWSDTPILRRYRLEGAAIEAPEKSGGLSIPQDQILPFFLAARSAVDPRKDLLGEALSSSFEAFRRTRNKREAIKDDQETTDSLLVELTHGKWYLEEFDRSLERCSGSTHPKVSASVRKIVDLWEAGEKVLVFAFYLHTCRALRVHISKEIERRLTIVAQHRLREAGQEFAKDEIDGLVEKIQNRYFDVIDSPGRRALEAAIDEIVRSKVQLLDKYRVSASQREDLVDVMRRFLRVPTTLIRCFPLVELESLSPAKAISRLLAYADGSGMTWRQKFEGFIEFIADQCTTDERALYLEAAKRIQTGAIRVEARDEESPDDDSGTTALANVQVASGETQREARGRLMRAFNTPFFPDILVCSQVMGEGVDLQRFCRHVIHHDLDWNPSSIEQRTGRIDRIGCKAERRQPIVIYLPYVAGTADERQFKVMADREQWFRIVMGQDEVAKLIAPVAEIALPLPETISNELNFKLGLE